MENKGIFQKFMPLFCQVEISIPAPLPVLVKEWVFYTNTARAVMTPLYLALPSNTSMAFPTTYSTISAPYPVRLPP